MNQVLLYSMSSEYIINILNGNKTIEVRKRDLPQWAKDKIARGEKVVGYGYCTKSFPYIEYIDFEGDRLYYEEQRNIPEWNLNGRVVVKFEVSGRRYHNLHYFNLLPRDHFELDKACITKDELLKYMNVKKGDNIFDLCYYAHHLTNITPIEPMGLGEFYRRTCIAPDFYGKCEDYISLTKAPQSFMTCWVKGE